MTRLDNTREQPLRRALDLDGITPQEHPVVVERLQSDHDHSICLIGAPEGACATHAFDLIDDAVYREIAPSGYGSIFAGKRLMQWLLDGRLQETESRHRLWRP